ncbi:YbaB/EbfC family nucleoid-associated protein [Nocardioides sp. AE5]|uniref:YbaB/EbfC family nucleoid-associated protein n=1 Tax=Nocardioides sp. AE5 TaxID=2962573 RepID=UPI002880F751|nr:YbaB/EbfC family nucleoid-associated protein [Nocardioides sp. AE5]MDT0202167.1 YbaB/EbfC family nucleoid-associated protein [Nocardioides sp. AE5]
MSQAQNPFAGQNFTTAEELMRNVTKHVAEAQAKAEQARTALADGDVTVSSPRDAITVTVTPMGTIKSVRFGLASEPMTPAQLTTAFMTTYHKATRQAMERSVAALESTLGETMVTRQMRQQMAEIPTEDDANPKGADR